MLAGECGHVMIHVIYTCVVGYTWWTVLAGSLLLRSHWSRIRVMRREMMKVGGIQLMTINDELLRVLSVLQPEQHQQHL